MDLPAQFPTLRLSWVQMELSPLPLGATPGPSFHLAAWAGQGRAGQDRAGLNSVPQQGVSDSQKTVSKTPRP